MTQVFVKECSNGIKETIKEAFTRFGGYNSIVKGKIYIKLNLTMADPSAITSPEVVVALIEYLKGEGADPENIFVFDNSAAGFATRVVFKTNNMDKKVRKTGVNLLYLDEDPYVDFDFEGEVLDKPIPFPKTLYKDLILNKGQNTYINVPKLKIHLQTGVTICLKNQHGLLYDAEKLYKHHLIDEKIVEIYAKIKPDFTIVDATETINHGVFAFKPDWIIPMNLIIAGIDGVAIDTVGAEILKVNNVKITELAGKRGLGESSFSNIEVVPDPKIIDEKSIDLNDDLDKVPIEVPDNIKIIKGTEWDGCKQGCKIAMFYLQMLTSGAKTGPLVSMIGRGFDTTMLDKEVGPFLVNGTCAVKELKSYFDQRAESEKIEVYYVDKHFDIGDFIIKAVKAGKIPLAVMSNIMKLPMGKFLTGYVSAKLHRANFISMM